MSTKMRKIILSTQEKKALAGLTAIGLFVAGSIYEIGKRNFWFEPKNTYVTKVRDADGLRLGSLVTLAGLRVGEVTNLDVDAENRIVVTLKVKKSVSKRIRKDSVATVFRAFIIGEKRIELIPGSDDQPEVADNGTLIGKDTTDLAEFVTGKKLAEIMSQVETLIAGLGGIMKDADKILGKYRDGSLDKTFALVNPALENFMTLSDDLIVISNELKTKSKDIPRIVDQGNQVLGSLQKDLLDNHLAKTTLSGVNVTLGKVNKSLGDAEPLMAQAADTMKNANATLVNANAVLTPLAERREVIAQLLGNLQDLSRELKKNPDYAQKVMEAVSEMTITLKALQRTWILSEQSKDVREGKPAE